MVERYYILAISLIKIAAKFSLKALILSNKTKQGFKEALSIGAISSLNFNGTSLNLWTTRQVFMEKTLDALLKKLYQLHSFSKIKLLKITENLECFNHKLKLKKKL